MSDSHIQIDYAPARSNKPWFRQWNVVLGIVIACWFFRDWPMQVWRDIRLEYYQRQCLAHPTSPGTIVYQSGTPPVVVRSLQCPSIYSALPVTYTAGTSTATLFVGRLIDSSGTSRLVTLEANIAWVPGKSAGVSVFGTTSRMGAFNEARPTGWVNSSYVWGISTKLLPSPEVIVRSVIPDQRDPSHISTDIDVFDLTYHWNWYLQTDGTLKWSDGTTTWRATGAPVL